MHGCIKVRESKIAMNFTCLDAQFSHLAFYNKLENLGNCIQETESNQPEQLGKSCSFGCEL